MPVQHQPDQGHTKDDHGPPHGAPRLPAIEVKRDQADEADRNGDQRGERRQPGETDNEEPADQGQHQRHRGKRQQDTAGGRDALAPAEAQVERPGMAHDGGQADQGQRDFLIAEPERDAQHDGNKALEAVGSQGCGEGARATGPEHISGPDIAAAQLAEVLVAVDLHHQPARRDGTEQIGEGCQHEHLRHGGSPRTLQL